MWKRFVVPIPVGVTVTLSLLYTMHALIKAGEEAVTQIKKPPVLMLSARVEDPVEVTPVDPPLRIDPPPELPPPPTQTNNQNTGSGVKLIRTPPPPPGPGEHEIGFPISDGPLVAIVRVAPEYPTIMSARGVEGFVTVRFDVDADGRTANISVVESSHSGFERAAVRAAEKFRYRPQIVDGQAVRTSGLQYRFRFEFDGK